MKITLNEKDKEVIKIISKWVIKCADNYITGVGCGAVGMLIFGGGSKKAYQLGFALLAAHLVISVPDDYKQMQNDTDKICNWVFDKLENSNQKVIEFEK